MLDPNTWKAVKKAKVHSEQSMDKNLSMQLKIILGVSIYNKLATNGPFCV